ncbi:MAG: 1-deoxy-D-xylulose-5-phosphate reductoisomerase [Actinobacteria bacterium]|uniref:1-deoxy-D-xylulose-5-phosphate reductoisomerase n=1 Tax=freshwater metagenome TaxID=449393 RepID=A0A6J6W163_9ZZZZ|nr:1-deoxy-D-xylulose-5-phosphate reductoisomerase [Actinomycetota bacterium]MSY67426.1 1-deoxy-D-xylulose-5-phosphate reductoisomerase [Actinomycetota bacterium]MTA01202.1 1-deoxy-D-xylulose-5-phosphate reductoisomerase [Actinomycetota bacterium]
MRDISILGSTGSIGVQALEVIAANPNQFRVVALAAGGSNISRLVEQVRAFGVKVVAVEGDGALLREALPGVNVIDGKGAAAQVAAIPVDVMLNAITGSVGLGPTLNALGVGNKVALANKESLVAGGDLVLRAAKPGQLIPVDSEHSALAQALRAGTKNEVSKLILTASGGPFRNRNDLSDVTIEEALAHPTWNMGPVVSINSATLVNKGLEIIEAHYLFDIPYSKIDAVIHPQSIIHSMVEFHDGSVIAQASPPSMKLPIALALSWPDRTVGAIPPIDWSTAHTWGFAPIDNAKFPAIDLARRCGEIGGAMPAIFNAANEEAVAAFLKGQIKFTEIIEIVDAVLQHLAAEAPATLSDIADVSAIEEDARASANQNIKMRGN